MADRLAPILPLVLGDPKRTRFSVPAADCVATHLASEEVGERASGQARAGLEDEPCQGHVLRRLPRCRRSSSR